MSNISIIPKDLIFLICKYLSPNDLFNISYSCHSLLWISYSNHIWNFHLPFATILSGYNLYSLFSLLKYSTNNLSISLVQNPILASSTDNHLQSVNSILDNSPSFWSSSGSPLQNSNEHIILQYHKPSLTLRITITPYKANYQIGMPTYAPKFINFQSGYSLNSLSFSTPDFPIKNINIPQTFDLSKFLLLGQFIKINLKERCTTQPGDDLYYTVLQHVDCQGVELQDIPFNNLKNAISYFIPREIPDIPDIPEIHKAETDPNRKINIHYIHKTFKLHYKQISNGNWQMILNKLKTFPSTSIYRSQNIINEIMSLSQDYCLKNNIPIHKPWKDYITLLIESNDTQLTNIEALEFALLFLNKQINYPFWELYSHGKFVASEYLGDLFRDRKEYQYAYVLYSHASVLDKMIDCLILMRRFERTVVMLLEFNYPSQKFIDILNQLMADDISLAKRFGLQWLKYDRESLEYIATAFFQSNLNSHWEMMEWLQHDL